MQWDHSLLPDACEAKGLEFCKQARNGQREQTQASGEFQQSGW